MSTSTDLSANPANPTASVAANAAAATQAPVWLAVLSQGHHFLLPLTHSGEIFAAAPVQPLPYVKPWVSGVSSLRGRLYLVVDLVRWLQWPAPAADAAGGRMAAAQFVSFSAKLDVNVLWPVDQLLGLRHAGEFERLPPGGMPDGGGVLRQVLRDANGIEWHDIDLQCLARQSEFLDINARQPAGDRAAGHLTE